MARKKSPHLTEAELRLMDVVWDRGAATVSEVAEALPKDLGLAYNTVLTTLRILEDKGYLRHTKRDDARAFVYQAVVGRNEAGRNAVRYLVSRFFRNSPELLVLNLLEDEELGERNWRAFAKWSPGRRTMSGVDQIARAALAGALNGLWIALALAAAAWTLARYLPRTNAATRHLLWWTVLALMLLPHGQWVRSGNPPRNHCRSAERGSDKRPGRLHSPTATLATASFRCKSQPAAGSAPRSYSGCFSAACSSAGSPGVSRISAESSVRPVRRPTPWTSDFDTGSLRAASIGRYGS